MIEMRDSIELAAFGETIFMNRPFRLNYSLSCSYAEPAQEK